MELHQLEYFVAVMEEDSFNRAATSMHLAPSERAGPLAGIRAGTATARPLGSADRGVDSRAPVRRDRARQIRCHPAPVMDQDPRRCQRTRRPAGQACLIGQVPQQHQPGVRHDTLTAAGYFEAPLWVAFCL